jgi:hypothetical protein
VLTDLLVNVLGIIRGGSKTSTNSPNRLISNDNVGPVLDLLNDGINLSVDNVNGLVSVTLLKGLANAENNAKTVIKSKLGLVSNKLVRLLDDGTALRVAENDPLGANILNLLNRDLTGKGTAGLVESVLGSNGDSGSLQVLLGPQKVGSRRRDDNLCKSVSKLHSQMISCT